MMRNFGKERVVVWTRQKRFFLYDPATRKFRAMSFKADKNFEVTNMGLASNTFWFSTNRGLYVANWNEQKKMPYWFQTDNLHRDHFWRFV